MGLLDQYYDPETTDSLKQFGSSPEAQKAARNQALLMAGLGILANNGMGPTRGASLGQALGRGGMIGMEAYNDALQQNQRQQMQQFQMAGALQDMGLKKMQTDQLKKQIAAKEALGSALKAGPYYQPAPEGQIRAGLSASSAAAFGAPELATDDAQVRHSVPGLSPASMMMAAARQAGDYDSYQEAMKLLMEEKKLAPKFATDTRTVMGPGGKPMLVQMADDGTVRPMTGYAPADKLHMGTEGGDFVARDPYTGQPVVKNRISMTPDAIASNALGWANYNKPQLQNIEGVGLVSVAPGKAATPVMMGGKPIVQEKPLTESQGKAAGFADRMIAAERTLSAPKASETPGVAEATLGWVPFIGDTAANLARDTGRQQYHQAQEDWVRAKLRKESGAVIGKDEMAAEIKTYFPQIGDSPEVIAQKAQSRREAINGISREGGSSYKPAEVPKAKSKSITLDDGSKVLGKLDSDGNYYVTRKGKRYRVEE